MKIVNRLNLRITQRLSDVENMKRIKNTNRDNEI